MFWSIAPLVLACIVLAGMLGMCSFAPGGPGPGTRARPTTPRPRCRPTPTPSKIPIRLPKLPDGWQSNSGQPQGHRRRPHRSGHGPAGRARSAPPSATSRPAACI